MSMGKRLKSILLEEGVSQRQFSEVIQIPLRSLEAVVGETRKPSSDLLAKIGKHEQFRKYTMWLLTGEVQPGTGQVCPSFSIQEQCGLAVSKSQKKA